MNPPTITAYMIRDPKTGHALGEGLRPGFKVWRTIGAARNAISQQRNNGRTLRPTPEIIEVTIRETSVIPTS